jgi:hypothetical protein
MTPPHEGGVGSWPPLKLCLQLSPHGALRPGEWRGGVSEPQVKSHGRQNAPTDSKVKVYTHHASGGAAKYTPVPQLLGGRAVEKKGK